MSYLELAKNALAERSPDAPDTCSKCREDASYYTHTGVPLCDSHAPKSTDGPLVAFAVEELGLTITGRIAPAAMQLNLFDEIYAT